MSTFKHPDFAERLKSAADAKKTALQKFRERPTASDPEFAERHAARGAVRVARDGRAAERKSARAAEVIARETARQSAIKTEAAAHEADIRERAAHELAVKADQKAGRDARYAARKAKRR